MCQATTEIEFSQISELVGLICDVKADWMTKGWSMCWFRGSNAKYDITPGQYRPTFRKLYGEDSTFREFKQKRGRGTSYIEHPSSRYIEFKHGKRIPKTGRE